jgi:N-hydroxyarylamine O-acetyltransferase
MSKVDIDAYFERIGFAGSIAPTLETLQQLHALHPAVIPFENLDPLLGVPVRLELANLQQKLLFEKRGGYCLEQNLLFKAMLEDLDFPVRGLGARVLLGQEEGADIPIDHMVLAVDVGGATYLCDVGFGGMTPTSPLRLRAEVEQETPHEPYRLVGGTPDWRLETRIGDEWRALYSFDMTEKRFEDYQAVNDLVSSSPRFRDNLIVARTEKGRRLALRNGRLNTHVIGAPSETRMLGTAAEVRDVLTNVFGIALPQNEKLDSVIEAALQRGAD